MVVRRVVVLLRVRGDGSSVRLMYGADELPLMLDQSVFSIRMRNTVWMAPDGRVVVVVVMVVLVMVEVVVGGRVVVVVVEEIVVVVVGGRVVVVNGSVMVVVVGGSVVVVVEAPADVAL